MSLIDNILKLRSEKKTYNAIATELGCTKDTVRYQCVKAGLGTNKNVINDRHKIKRNNNKKRAIEYCGGACNHCGYNKSTTALDFHHINPETKSGEIGNLVKYSWDKLKAELDKCILLCSNCHREEHERLNKIKDAK
jgi:5-methylcytosine-specific restriction endonuclease McrA